MSLWETELQSALNTESDFQGHVAYLEYLAYQSTHGVVEMGVRGGVSTRAILGGLAKRSGSFKPSLTSYDIRQVPGELSAIAASAGVPWRFRQQDTTEALPCPVCDLLFIDTLHTGEQLARELRIHAHRALRWIVLHDTVTFGERGETPGSTGLLPALQQFLAGHPEWSVHRSFAHSHGLTVLERRLPFLVALCPTFRRPEMLANSLACWKQELYPAERRALIILDDGGTWDPQHDRDDAWELFTTTERCGSIPEKFNQLALLAETFCPQADWLTIWEDDDLYLPWHLAAQAHCYDRGAKWSRPQHAWSNYQRRFAEPNLEETTGRFHGSWGVRASHFAEIGGYPETPELSFDQQFGRKLGQSVAWWGTGADSNDGFPPSYVYRWGSAAWNGSSSAQPDWYTRLADVPCPPRRGQRLQPEIDAESEHLLAWLELHGHWH